MAYLGTIVRHLEDTFHVKVHGQFHTRTEIEGTRFLTQKPDTDPDHGDKLLYIACSQTAAPSGCPEAAFSAGVLQAAAPSCHQPNILLTGQGHPRTTAESYMSGKSWMPARYLTPSRRSSSGTIG